MTHKAHGSILSNKNKNEHKLRGRGAYRYILAYGEEAEERT